MKFWPSDIAPTDVRTPEELLLEAAEELQKIAPALSAHIVSNELDDRVVVSFRVQYLNVFPVVNLFDVQHRIDAHYPAAIIPPNSDIPEYLRKRRLVKGMSFGVLGLTQRDEWVENEWVCTSPDEFSKKLQALLSSDIVKARILSLIAAQKSAS